MDSTATDPHPGDPDDDRCATADRRDALVRRVRKLLDKAAQTTNQHEADAFSRKAAELIAAHRIDPGRLAAADDELAVVEIELGRGAYVRARLALLTAVADANDVEVVFRTSPTGTVALAAGFRGDLDVTRALYHALHAQAAGAAAQRRAATAAATQRDRRSFLFGFADRTRQLLDDANADRRAAPSETAASDDVRGADLALVERRRRVEDFAAGQWGRTRAARAPAAPARRGYWAGATAAEHADIGRTRLAGRRAIGWRRG